MNNPSGHKLILGGAIWGNLIGLLAGAAIGSIYGGLLGDLSLGLTGAIFGGLMLAAVGASYGAFLNRRWQHDGEKLPALGENPPKAAAPGDTSRSRQRPTTI